LSDRSPGPTEKGKRTRTLPGRLSSPEFVVKLLSFLAVASIIGTVFPQGERARDLISRMDPAALSFIELLQLTDIFHSFWFVAPGILLALNLVFCLYRRWSSVKTAPLPGQETGEALKIPTAHRIPFFAIHGGILILLAGALLSRFLGIEAFMEIPVGEKMEKAFLHESGKPLDLGFQVRCDGFHLERYASGMPKEFRSELTFFRDSAPVRKVNLLVNHPVSFDGITFYQSDFRKILKARLTIQKGDRTEERELLEGREFELSGSPADLKIHVVSIMENFMTLGPAAKLAVPSPEGYRNLFVFRNIDRLLEMTPDLYERYPPFDPGGLPPYRFRLAGLEETYVTGLMVNRDPGAPVAAGGASVLMAGALLTYLGGKGRNRSRRKPAGGDHESREGNG